MPYLLCSDLDRTLLPNGLQEESPRARPLLRALAAEPDVTLAYVSGRDQGLIRQAIAEFDLPTPHYAIGDVGTTLYRIEDGIWHPWREWSEEIAPDWRGRRGAELAPLFADLAELRLQEPEKQGEFKLSYYADPELPRGEVLAEVERRLADAGVRATLIWSVDETSATGLLDLLPRSATKLHAVRFLMARLGHGERETVYAGDSGNDLPVLVSGLQAVLVANATEEVRAEALREAGLEGVVEALHLARGGHLGMNGNYSAGVLEGLAHFIPELGRRLERLAGR